MKIWVFSRQERPKTTIAMSQRQPEIPVTSRWPRLFVLVSWVIFPHSLQGILDPLSLMVISMENRRGKNAKNSRPHSFCMACQLHRPCRATHPIHMLHLLSFRLLVIISEAQDQVNRIATMIAQDLPHPQSTRVTTPPCFPHLLPPLGTAQVGPRRNPILHPLPRAKQPIPSRMFTTILIRALK